MELEQWLKASDHMVDDFLMKNSDVLAAPVDCEEMPDDRESGLITGGVLLVRVRYSEAEEVRVISTPGLGFSEQVGIIRNGQINLENAD